MLNCEDTVKACRCVTLRDGLRRSWRFSGALDVTKIPIRPIPYAESSGTVPRWLEAAQVRPRVYLTLGTVVITGRRSMSRRIGGSARQCWARGPGHPPFDRAAV